MKTVQIGNKTLGDGNPCFISLEPSAAYTDFMTAENLLRGIAGAGADAVKFQTFLPGDAERMMGQRKDILVEFGTATGQKEESVYEALSRRELSKEQWQELTDKAHQVGLLFITAPYFFETVNFLVESGVDAIKVSKGDVNNVLLIEAIAKTKLPVIIDGREKFEDVKKAIEICEKAGNSQIVVMHCPGGYPAPDHTVHLRAIPAIKEMTGYPVGFSDHSFGDIMNYAAVALGVNMLEKTVTLDKTTEHVEHYMSLEPQELKGFIKNIRVIEQAMGNPEILQSSRVNDLGRRSFVAKTDIKAGETVELLMVDFRRPGNEGISVAEGYSVLGKKAKQDIKAGTFLQWEMLQ